MNNRNVFPDDHTPSNDSTADDDLLLQQVRDALAPMPTVNRQKIADILSAVAERRQTPVQRFWLRAGYALDQFRYTTSPLARGTAVAALFVIIGYVSRGALTGSGDAGSTAPMVADAALPRESMPGAAAPSVPLQAVEGATDPSQRLVSVQFVLDAREVADAGTVSVVGDFNNWDVAAHPMTLDRGAWSVSLPATPGRHDYAFVINGERWIADPRAPRSTDTDFGRPGSVILVQTP